MKSIRISFAIVFVISLLQPIEAGAASATDTVGYVTPTSLTITFNSISLVSADNGNQTNVWTGSNPVTFKRSDPSFTANPLGAITLPYGRYSGVSIGYSFSYSATLNGVLYQGQQSGNFVDNTSKIYTVAAANSDGSVANSLSTTAPAGGGTNVLIPSTNGSSSGSSVTTFLSPLCVQGGSATCQSGDTTISSSSPSGAADINILYDLYHSVQIDEKTMAIFGTIGYPYATIGTPGAAVHLTASATNNSQPGRIYADGTLIFSGDKKLQFGSLGGMLSGSDPTSTGRFPGVSGGVNVAPAGTGGAGIMIGKFNTSTGQLQFPAGGCTGSSCFSTGLTSIDNILQTSGSSVNVSCTADATGAIGYTYTGGSCTNAGAGPTSMKIGRIVDPSNLLGTCTGSSSAGYISAGLCANTTGDGYP